MTKRQAQLKAAKNNRTDPNYRWTIYNFNGFWFLESHPREKAS